MLQGDFVLAEVPDVNAFPYRAQPWSPDSAGTTEATLVPYFAWGNRHPGQTMRVWLPELR